MDEKKSIKQKGEYVAVPTSDVEEAMLPAYEEVENPAEKSQRRKYILLFSVKNLSFLIKNRTIGRRRFRFLLIGGAIALLGLTHLCSNNMNDVCIINAAAATAFIVNNAKFTDFIYL
jgi:hypothetical protein